MAKDVFIKYPKPFFKLAETLAYKNIYKKGTALEQVVYMSSFFESIKLSIKDRFFSDAWMIRDRFKTSVTLRFIDQNYYETLSWPIQLLVYLFPFVGAVITGFVLCPGGFFFESLIVLVSFVVLLHIRAIFFGFARIMSEEVSGIRTNMVSNEILNRHYDATLEEENKESCDGFYDQFK